MKNEENKLSEKEIIEALERSGYILESEIAKNLLQLGFFVESNISSLDPLTGKGREIDLLAEFNHIHDKERHISKVVAFTRFVFEIKNNNTPFVLLTKHEESPNSEVYNGLKSRLTIPEGLENIHYWNFFEVLFLESQKKLYTQYCTFSKKKNEQLMAHHPENIYSGLLKIVHFCEDMTNEDDHEIEEKADGYLRNFLYLPILLISDDLFELDIDENNETQLRKTDCSYLVFNYHYRQTPKTAIIHIVTKKGLRDLLDQIIIAEKVVEKNMNKAKTELLKKNKI